MAPIYVREQGAVIRRKGERVIITTPKDKPLLDVPLLHVDQLVLFGNVQLTSQAMAMLLQAEVDVVFLSRYGKFRGRLIHTGSKFAKLRHAQLHKMSNEATTLAIARQVITGKLHNQQAVLEQAMAYSSSPLAVQQAVGQIGRMRQQAQKTRQIDSLRGFEGKAGADYWSAIRSMVPPQFGFRGRKYFPPPDPVNGLFSFGYSLLLKDVTAAVQLVGLDPYLGFFHTIDYGRPSLALDMMEEFRPVLVDWVVVALLAAGQMTSADYKMTDHPKRPVQLKERIMERFIHAYEQRSHTRFYHKDANGETSLRRVIELQVRRLARLVLGQTKNYRPFVLK